MASLCYCVHGELSELSRELLYAAVISYAFSGREESRSAVYEHQCMSCDLARCLGCFLLGHDLAIAAFENIGLQKKNHELGLWCVP